MSAPRPTPEIVASAPALFALQSLAGDAMAGWLLPRLREAGVEALLLKGPTIARWLYDADEVRPSSDVDVLVNPRDFHRAEELLGELGFENRYDGASPEWAEEHADSWTHERWPIAVDLHRWVWGVGVTPEEGWAALSAGSEVLDIAGREVDMPREAVRLLLVVLHAQHHGGQLMRPTEEVRRAIARSSPTAWSESAALARSVGAERAFADGLRMLPEGGDLLDELELRDTRPAEPEKHPRLWSAPPTTEGFLRLSEARTRRERAQLLWREFLPSRSYMRSRSRQTRLARRGGPWLAVAYVSRWWFLATRAREGLRASRELRRDA